MTHASFSTVQQATDQRNDHESDTSVASVNLDDLARQVFARQLELRGRFRDSLRVGVTVGHLLSRAKEICPHGEFQRWLKRHFEGSVRHAQRLMTLAHEYPRPEDIPTLSLREALRLIAGRTNKDEKHLAHQRLSRQTMQLALRGVIDLAKTLENKVVAPLEIEGVTAKHPAMKSAKKIGAAIRRLAEYLRAELQTVKRNAGEFNKAGAVGLVEQFRKPATIDVGEAEEIAGLVSVPNEAAAEVGSEMSLIDMTTPRTITIRGTTYEVQQFSGQWQFRATPEAGWTACSTEMAALIEIEAQPC